MAGQGVRARLRAASGAFASTWANADLRRAQLGFGCAWTAEWSFTVGLGVLAFQKGGAGAVGVVSLLRMLPAAAVTPFVMVYADRWRREGLLVAVSVARGCTVAVVAVLAATEAPVGWVYALAVVATASAAVFRPVHSALLPSLCRTPTELAGANVVRGMLDSLSTLLGPALAAVLLATSGLPGVFWAVAGASLVSAVVLARVRPETGPSAHRQGPGGVLPELAEGLRGVRMSHELTLLIVLAGVQTFVRGALAVFSVVVAIELLDMGETGVGVLNGAVGAGAVVGSAAASLLVGNRHLARWFGLGVAGWGLPLAVLGVLPSQGAAVALLLCIGVANALVDAGVFTLVSRFAPTGIVGRVFGVMDCLGSLTVGAGAAITPLVIELAGVRSALVVLGVVSPLLVALSWRSLRRLDGSLDRRNREIDLLRSVEMLAALPLPAIEMLAIALEPLEVLSGDNVFVQGDPGDRCYVVESGTAEVLGDGRLVARLERGQLFGEIALLRQVPRTATVRAATDLRLDSLARDRFLPLVTGFRASAGRATTRVDDLLERYHPVDE